MENKLKKHNENHSLSGTLVIVKNNDVGRALRKFKSKVQDNNIIQEYRDRQAFVKPSEARRKRMAAAKARWAKKQKEMNND
jgi:ribosomal protein S21